MPNEAPLGALPVEPVGELVFGPFSFDPVNKLLRRNGLELPLPPRVLGVLDYLLRHPGRVVARQDLMDTVWKEAFVTDTSLAEAVSFLRQTLGDDAQAPRFIQTVHRRGYRFVATVQRASDPSAGDSRRDSAAAVDIVSPSIAGQLLPWSLTAILAVTTVVALWQLLARDHAGLPALTRFVVQLPQGTHLDPDRPALAVAPDGSAIAFAGCHKDGCQLFLRALANLRLQAVAGTIGAAAPFFSPDSRWLGFFAEGKLKKLALAGGLPMTLADAPQPFGATWGADGRIIFAASFDGGLQVVSDRGGPATPLTTPDPKAGEFRHGWPEHAADGRSVLFTIADAPSGGTHRAAALSLDTGRWRTLLEDAAQARHASPGYLLFARGPELHAIEFDAGRLAVAGVPTGVLPGTTLATDPPQFSISRNGTFAVSTAESPVTGVVRISSAGAREDVPNLPAGFASPALSPDGHHVAGVVTEGTRSDVWTADVERGALVRVTYGGVNLSPVWSPGGQAIVFASRAGGPLNVFSKAADGSGTPVRLTVSPHHQFPTSISPDGRLVAITDVSPGTKADIMIGSTDHASSPRPFLQGAFDETAGVFSPDGRWMAYQSDESGQWQVYVRPFPGPGAKYPVSIDGGAAPFWAPDGRTLYYRNGERLMATTFGGSGSDRIGTAATPDTSTDPRIGRPVLAIADPSLGVFAAGPGGLLIAQRDLRRETTAIEVTLDWIPELRRLVPPTVMLPR